MLLFIKKFFKRIVEDEYYRNSVILVIFAVIGSIGNYVFQIYSNRNMSKDDYGMLNTLLSLLMITGVFTGILGQWSKKVFSEIKSHNVTNQLKTGFIYFFKFVGFFSALFIIILVLFYGQITTVYKMNSFIPLILLLITLILDYIKIPFVSFLQSYTYFLEQSIANTINIAFKLIFTAIFIFFTGLNLNNAMIALAIANLISLLFFILFTYLKIRKIDHKKANKQEKIITSQKLDFFFKIGLTALFMVLLNNIDMQIVRINLTKNMSGDFATASVFGKIVLWIGSITIPIFYVSINDKFHKKKPYMKEFLKGMAIIILSTLGAYILIVLFARPFVNLFNKSYLNAIPEIKYYALSVIPYVLINVFVNFFTSINRYKSFFVFLAMAIGQGVLLYFFGTNIDSIISIRLYTGIAILLAMITYFIINRNKFYEYINDNKTDKTVISASNSDK